MAVEQKIFGKTPSGQDIMLFTIINKQGMKASVTNLGAVLVSLMVPDKKGNIDDVVLGYDKGEDYFGNPSFFGATVGPGANRIAGAKITIENTTYLLDVNDGNNNLHSHKEKGYHKRMWEAQTTEDSVRFLLEDIDGNLGFPGNKTFQVTYSLNEENALSIHYHAVSDKKTLINPTNHTYFNLEGHKSGSIEKHVLWLGASQYTPVVAGSIPTGEILPTAGTPMDFTKRKPVGEEIDADFEQLELTGGYDHNWVIDDWDGTLRHFATVEAPESGRIMKAYTTLPGVQFYAGNFIQPENGKEGACYEKRHGLCLETQYFPDSVNQPNFPSCIFGEEKQYDSRTVYQFL